MTESLLSRASNALRILTGHDSDVNLKYVYGDKWWEPINVLRRDLELEIAREAKVEDIYLSYDHQVGKWCVDPEPPKVIRTGAEVIHAKIVTRDLYGEKNKRPFAWRWEYKPEHRHGDNAKHEWYTTTTPPNEQDLRFRNYEPLYTETDVKKKAEELHTAFMNS